MTQKELAFINTSYTSKKIKKYSLSNTFKKDELAYFLEKIHTKEIDLEKKINIHFEEMPKKNIRLK